MKRYLSLSLLSLFSLVAFAQQGTFSNAGDNDPAAKKILDKLKSEYQNFDNIDIDFNLEIEFPGDAAEFQKGSVTQKGEMFRLDMGDQELICNGSTIWVFLKEMNEVQINDFEEEDGSEFMSPKDVFSMYDSGEFTYAISNESNEDGKAITQIEFKPLNKESEYSKMRLTLSDNNKSVKRLKVFAKDGSRYTMHIKSLKSDGNLDESHFNFKKEDYPGVTIEDLRL